MKADIEKKTSRGGKRPNSGRPLSDNPRSTHLGFVKITPENREKIRKDAKKAGFASDSEYVRERLGL